MCSHFVSGADISTSPPSILGLRMYRGDMTCKVRSSLYRLRVNRDKANTHRCMYKKEDPKDGCFPLVSPQANPQRVPSTIHKPKGVPSGNQRSFAPSWYFANVTRWCPTWSSIPAWLKETVYPLLPPLIALEQPGRSLEKGQSGDGGRTSYSFHFVFHRHQTSWPLPRRSLRQGSPKDAFKNGPMPKITCFIQILFHTSS